MPPADAPMGAPPLDAPPNPRVEDEADEDPAKLGTREADGGAMELADTAERGRKPAFAPLPAKEGGYTM